MLTKSKKLVLLAAACPSALLLMSSSVRASSGDAAGGLEEIVVTAQKREQALQDVPIAITALSRDQLEAKGITSFEGIAATTPSINFSAYPNSSSTLILYMRGQGTADSARINAEGAVGLYEDGFYIARPQGATLDLADIERVEVLRGPQGTLYGRNTTGGAVNIISKKPTGEFGVRQTLDFGSRDQFRSLTTVDLPKWGNLSLKGTALRSSIDGYVKNTGSSHDFGSQRQTAGKLQALWESDSNIRAEAFTEYSSMKDTPLYFENALIQGIPINGINYDGIGPRATTYRAVDLPLSPTNFFGNGLTLTWDVSDALKIKSLTGYHQLRSTLYQDYAESILAAPFFPLGYTTRDTYRQHQISQELQATGELLDGHLTYAAGLYYFHEKGRSSNNQNITTPTFPSPATILDQTFNVATTAKAVYGQVSWIPDEARKIEVTFGARYSGDHQNGARVSSANGAVIENGAATGDVLSTSSSRFTPSGTINYKWTDDISTYAKVATGYRAGGLYDAAAAGDFKKSAFGPEIVTSYETGLKSSWLEDRVRFNLAGFYSKFSKIQLAYYTTPSISALLKQNAGRATIEGLEAELTAVPVENLTVGVNYAALYSKLDQVDVLAGSLYDHATNPASPYHVGGNIAELFYLQHAPKHSLNITSDYKIQNVGNGRLLFHLDYRWQAKAATGSDSGKAFPNRELNFQPAYGYLDGRIVWTGAFGRGPEVKIGIWGKNLTDTRYQQATFGLKAGPFPASGGFYSQFVSYAPPRSYGVTLGLEF